jgi:hypothetical protein
MMLPTDPTIIAVVTAVSVTVVGWFAHTILGMRDQVQDLHRAIFDHNDRPGALTRLDKTEERLKRHSNALRALGALDDE